jgi:hypothetical protein
MTVHRTIATVFAFFAVIGAFPAHAAALKNSEFMKMSAGQRHYYYAGAYDVLGHWTSLNQPDKAECVWNWLFEKPKERKALLEKSLKLYPDHAPTSVIIALLQRDCGVVLSPVTTQN